ncbi:hypothetical protein DI392_01255 [Vibrio albus]|uniref:54K polar flagellar sheath protein A n=1 Tax=Vibrio albus TaxID=2200953 RepID=A0A2U3BDY1_9VIBR|nr:hypothetical protein [Vibrio albus]PWI34934.1 hypothetical protein DI392_01255 [Vibrio albus]
MKTTTKMLPLVAIVSGMLVGCGGSSSSGGGSAPTTSYSLSFLQAYDENAGTVNSTCTIFNRDTTAGTVKTYRTIGDSLDANIVAFYTDANGARSGEIITADDGSLQFVLESIPDGGAITFEERDGRDIIATTFTKAFLSRDTSLKTTKFGVIGSVAGTSCVTGTGTNFVTENRDSLSYLHSSDIAGSGLTGDNLYHYRSQQAEFSPPNASLTSGQSIKAYTAEQTAIVQYQSGPSSQVFQYGFEDWPKDTGSVVMSFTGTQGTVTEVASPNIGYTDIDVNLLYGGFAYDLTTFAKGVANYYHPSETNNETWSFIVSGKTGPGNSWDAAYYGQVSDSWDFNVDETSLFDLSGLNDAKPTASTPGNVISLASGINFSSEKGIQRVSYRKSVTESGFIYTVTHNIYSELTATIIVPVLEYFNFPSTVQSDLLVDNDAAYEQYFLFATENSTIENADFVSLFKDGDGISLASEKNGIVRNELETNESSVRLQSNEHIRLYRSN